MAEVNYHKRNANDLHTYHSENTSADDAVKVLNRKKPKVGKRKYKEKNTDPTSPSGVLLHEIREILKRKHLLEDNVKNDMRLILNDEGVDKIYHRIVSDVIVEQLLSNGDGIAIIPHPVLKDGRQICIIPFGLPGDVVDVRVFKSHPLYVESDLLKVKEHSKYRDDSLIKCKYFGRCSGCQFQDVEYADQLMLKRQTIVNAYKFFAPRLYEQEESLHKIEETEPSPLIYGYRTKLTPHFNLPYKRPEKYDRPTLGFGAKGKPEWRDTKGGPYSVLDIEDCVIGTKIINMGLSNERKKFEEDYMKYKKGATILLREDSRRVEEYTSDSEMKSKEEKEDYSVKAELPYGSVIKTYTTNSRKIVTEYVKHFKFQFSAGEFFQNNNSILPAVTDYVRSKLFISGDLPTSLIDAYCGSGLFSITCSKDVSNVIGVEVSADSVKFAQLNARNNDIKNAKFIVGKAERIFEDIDAPPASTSIILDPPRKGCDSVFLNQLSDFNPAKIVYISCNVHSQARDIEEFMNQTKNGHMYYVESIKGFDFFPQTHHVESVAVLALKSNL